MKWIAKAIVQKGIAALPQPERVNYVFQLRIAKSLPSSDDRFVRKVQRANHHVGAFLEYGSRSLATATFYEFGVGWDLVVPLAYYALGVERQILVDIRPNIRTELVEHTLQRFVRLREELERELEQPLRPCDARGLVTINELEQRFGITYLAPRDARATGLPAESVDFISSTDTLEHIPEPDIARILRECRRLLKPEGVVSFRIDMRDHYSYFDRSISQYNFLKFPRPIWSLANSAVHYQNRLRHSDYIRLTEAAGLEVLHEALARPTEAELDHLRRMRIARSFERYALEDLGTKSISLVARPSSAAGSDSPGYRLRRATNA